MSLITRPGYVDDTGDGLSGTEINKSWIDSVFDAIDALLHSTTNPTLTPKGIIDEVKTARGTLASLDARLDVEHNDDGTHKLGVALVTRTQIQDAMGGVNLLANDDFLIWPAGDAAAPTYWAVDGTPARTGVGLADTRRKHGKYALKVTGNGITAPAARQVALDVAVFPDFAALRGREVTFGIRVWTGDSDVRAYIVDSAAEAKSDPHSGSAGGGPESDGWEWLTVTHALTGSSGELVVGVSCDSNPSAVFYVSGAVLVLGEVAPTDWIPSPRSVRTWHSMRTGNQTALTDGANLTFHRPAIVLDVRLHVRTAPTGQALIVDVNHWDGAAFQSMFSTRPQIAATALDGQANPDGTYRYRCFAGMEVAAPGIADAQCSVDVDQAGSGAPGTDLTVEVRYMQYDRALEGILAWND